MEKTKSDIIKLVNRCNNKCLLIVILVILQKNNGQGS